ncbi:hypothetical protein CR513_04906, partial [Mucuna pruriens]
MTARMKIGVHVETLSMEFWDTFVKFNFFEELKHPIEKHSIFSIDAIDGLFRKANRAMFDSKGKKKVETDSNMQELAETKSINLEGVETVSNNQEEAGSDSTNNLNKEQEEKLLLDTSRPSRDQPLHLHAQNSIRGGCLTN